MAKDAGGHGSEAHGGGGDSMQRARDGLRAARNNPMQPFSLHGGGGFVQGLQPMTPEQQKTLLGRTTPLPAAHATGVDQIGRTPAQGQMKMSPGDFAALHAAVSPHMASTANPANSAMRQRWDALHKSGYNTSPLYKSGLNDAHIDTALRKIQGQK